MAKKMSNLTKRLREEGNYQSGGDFCKSDVPGKVGDLLIEAAEELESLNTSWQELHLEYEILQNQFNEVLASLQENGPKALLYETQKIEIQRLNELVKLLCK